MKKEYNILVVVWLVFGLVGTAMIFQAASAKNIQSAHNQISKPVFATNIQIVKKISIPTESKKAKGKPSSPPGQDKDDYEWIATGELGLGTTGEKYAIIIGICDYPGATSLDLCQSDGDSLNMYKALTELYEYKPANIRLFKDMGGITGSTLNNAVYAIPTYSNIFNAIEEIKGLATSSDDEIVFFFSGHGTRGTANDGDNEDTDEAIVVWDTEDDTAYNVTYIWDGELKNWFSGFATSRITFIFDTCLAGGMNDLADEEMSDNGRIVVMATDETHSAYVFSTGTYDIDGDGTYDGEGVFTRLFVNKGMLQNMADGYNEIGESDESVAIEEAFDYAKQNIPPQLKRRQKPVINDSFNNDLLL